MWNLYYFTVRWGGWGMVGDGVIESFSIEEVIESFTCI